MNERQVKRARIGQEPPPHTPVLEEGKQRAICPPGASSAKRAGSFWHARRTSSERKHPTRAGEATRYANTPRYQQRRP